MSKIREAFDVGSSILEVRCFAIFALVVCGFSATAAEPKLRVLATFAPIYSLTKNVTGDCAEVEMLLPPNVGPHDFSFSPADMKKIARADVIVSNGLGLEEWLGKALRSGIKNESLSVVASKGIETIGTPPNPHVWLDPIRAIHEVETVRDGLKAKDPANAASYEQNAAKMAERLHQLDKDIRAATEKLSDKRMLPFHDSFPYFAARYGFQIVGVFEEFPGKEPTPKTLRRLREVVAQKHVRVLFSEPQYEPQILRSLSEELHVPIVVIDPMETGKPSADLYEDVMRKNLQSLTDALK